jgi:hypothetical protein
MFTALAAISRGGMFMYSIEALLDCSLVQSIPNREQSTRLFLQPSELRPSHLFSPNKCVPLPLVPGGGTHSLSGEGVGWVLIRTRGQILWYLLYRVRAVLTPVF